MSAEAGTTTGSIHSAITQKFWSDNFTFREVRISTNSQVLPTLSRRLDFPSAKKTIERQSFHLLQRYKEPSGVFKHRASRTNQTAINLDGNDRSDGGIWWNKPPIKDPM